MQKKLCAYFIIVACLARVVLAVTAPLTPSLRLPDSVVPVRYRVELTLDPSLPTFSGSIFIQIRVKRPVKTIWLNATKITVGQISFRSGTKTFAGTAVGGGGDFVGLEFDGPVPTGAAELRIRYTGGVREGNASGIFRAEDNGNRYLYTQFEPTDTRAAFPCFDEPSYKVPWQLTLNVPQADIAISNAPVMRKQRQSDRTVYSFAATKPLPSYLVAFAVGPFDIVDAGKGGIRQIPLHIITPKGHAKEAEYAAGLTASVLDRLERYFGMPFPYDKLDQVAVPTNGLGMENAGLVTYSQDRILVQPDRDTEEHRRSYARVALHEIGHQWFGDFVTNTWWNDLWLNEAFADWIEQKLLAEWKPDWETRTNDVDNKLDAEDNDSLLSARKVRQDITSKDDIANAFDTITYRKGAAVIRMFENWVGPERFRKGVQLYLRRYAFRNATASDFLEALSSAADMDFGLAFSTFLDQAGVPLLSVALDCRGGPAVVHLNQARFLPVSSKEAPDQKWQIPVCIRYGQGDVGKQQCMVLTQPQSDLTLKSAGCPVWVQANDNAVGYYRVDYRGNLLRSLTEGNVAKRLDAPERADLMGNVEALTSAGKLSAGDALALVDTFHDDPGRSVLQSALNLALQPSIHLVSERALGNYQRFLCKNFQARAHQLGWLPKDREPDDARLLRPYLLRAVATYGGDEELAQEARHLTDQWLTDQTALPSDMISAVLGTAAYYGDKTLLDQYVLRYRQATDRQQRSLILNAMSENPGLMQSFRDPAAILAEKQAVLSGAIPFIEGAPLLFTGQRAQATRRMPLEFMNAHFEELAAKRPTVGGRDWGMFFPYVGAEFCDEKSKAELKGFFETRVDRLTGAPRVLSQVLESVDTCIAEKQSEELSVEKYLGTDN